MRVDSENLTLIGSFALSCLVAVVAVLGVTILWSRADSKDGVLTVSATEDRDTSTSTPTQSTVPPETSAPVTPLLSPTSPPPTSITTITTTATVPAPPLPPHSDQVSVTYGLATCESGFEMVFGGSTRDGFDIAICADSRGAIRYHGIKRGSNADIRLWACLWGGNRFDAINGQHRYIIDLGDLPEALVVTGPEGETLVNDVFLQTTFTPADGLTTC